MREIKVNLPITDSTQYQAGDKLLLTGTIYTARDQAHRKLIEDYQKNGCFPIPIKGSVIYYVGPSPTPVGEVIGSCGPTTSYRMDQFTPTLLEAGMKLCIGKGNRNKKVRKSLIENNGLYGICVGGAAVFQQQFIKSMEIILYPELLSEAVHKLEVEDFPVFIANDTTGKTIFFGEENYDN